MKHRFRPLAAMLRFALLPALFEPLTLCLLLAPESGMVLLGWYEFRYE